MVYSLVVDRKQHETVGSKEYTEEVMTKHYYYLDNYGRE